MIQNNNLIKLYRNTSFKKKKKYELKDFIDFQEVEGIYQIGSGYKAINEENEYIDEDLNELNIPSFMNQKSILTKDKNLCVHFLYLDLYILIQKYNLKKIEFNEFRKEVYDYFNFSKKEIAPNSKNKTFLMSNKHSIELPRDKALYPSLEAFRRELGVILLEVPMDYKINETFKFLREVRAFLNKAEIKKLNTHLRIRKILKLKKNGMFIVNGNTLIIDPRRPEKIIHEIGHYIYENRLAFNLNGKRIYKNRFEQIVNKNQSIIKEKKHKFEDYEKDSEIFAYWFESQFK